jgi:hypothetical protein
MLLLTVLGFVACIVPGVIMYIMVIRKATRFQFPDHQHFPAISTCFYH